ncbi:MAG: thioredoxin [Succinivibrio sp.]|nr:thioredoxin [Succinivibrio sp.]
MSDKVLHISDNEFEQQVLKAEQPVLVDFWATWCGPCRAVAPLIEELAEELPNVKFVKVDIDQNTAYASQYGVMSIPTLLLFKNGEVAGKQIGAISKSALKGFIESFA